jgi:hypothetical protein
MLHRHEVIKLYWDWTLATGTRETNRNCPQIPGKTRRVLLHHVSVFLKLTMGHVILVAASMSLENMATVLLNDAWPETKTKPNKRTKIVDPMTHVTAERTEFVAGN